MRRIRERRPSKLDDDLGAVSRRGPARDVTRPSNHQEGETDDDAEDDSLHVE
jgi:hypothetical protein